MDGWIDFSIFFFPRDEGEMREGFGGGSISAEAWNKLKFSECCLLWFFVS